MGSCGTSELSFFSASDFSDVACFKMASELSDYATARYPLQKEDNYPAFVKQLPGNLIFIDFGKDAFGRLKLNLPGKIRFDSLTIRLGEAQKMAGLTGIPEALFVILNINLV